VVIDNFNVKHVTIFPTDADTPLVIDPDAVLSFAIPSQNFKPIARWHFQVLKAFYLVQIQKLSACNPLDRSETRHILILEQGFSP